jgi:hypothetical protein
VRSRFVNSAFWAPHLVTDEEGQARFSFTAPDNLTAFRVMAVAADDGTRFGSGEKRFTIKKPLLAKPVLPRFAGEGDKVEVGVSSITTPAPPAPRRSPPPPGASPSARACRRWTSRTAATRGSASSARCRSAPRLRSSFTPRWATTRTRSR